MNFYDTSALLDLGAAAFDPAALPFLIADMTLHELEEIKTSGKKSEEIRYKARTVTRLLAEHRDDGSYTVVAVPMSSLFYILDGKPISDNNDATIMATARWWLDTTIRNLEDAVEADQRDVVFNLQPQVDSFKFVTSDLSCANIAGGILQLPVAAILADCLGGEVALERAITDGWVEIQPLGFIRGRSFQRSIIYCSEAENLTKEHIQLLIGRVGEGSSLWINGDLRQIDDVAFERNNGIQKLIEKVTGDEHFASVYLPITERSETARIADKLD